MTDEEAIKMIRTMATEELERDGYHLSISGHPCGQIRTMTVDDKFKMNQFIQWLMQND